MRFFILLLSLFIINQGVAQDTYRVQRGERPSIDLDNVPESAYHKGMIKIKLNENYGRQLDESPAKITNGVAVFGIENIDRLNRFYGINSFKKTFESPAFQAKMTDRHRAWGFHLWYYLYFDESAHVIDMVKKYASLPDVMIAEPEYVKVPVYKNNPANAPEGFSFKGPDWTPDDPRFNEQWHYHNTGQLNGVADSDIDLPEAWEIEKGNPEVIVAIIDQGVQFSHPDLAANMWSGIGFNFTNNSPNIVPGNHGSHVGGTVSGVNNNGLGIAGVAGGTGAGDGVRLMSCQVFSPTTNGGFHLAPVYAADNGASISQNSWGYTIVNYYDQNVLDAIDYFNINGGGDALADGGITIFAAGNDGTEGNWYPGVYSGCFSVAATNNQDKRSWYSNYGTWIDVSAPGGETHLVSARGVLSCFSSNNYGFYQGTSMACPHVSGIAALMISMAYGQLTPPQVADILRNTTDDHYAVNPGYVGKLGTGRVNAYSALVETMNHMYAVNNPISFNALPATNEIINLNWEKNAENNDVMVAWNTTDTFGSPEDSVVYENGSELEGGGTIIFAGSENAISHEGLNSNTTYYYRAWSFNDDYEYSPGISTSGTTLKEPVVDFPYHQGFEEEAFPPASWENIKFSGTGTGLWDRQTEGTSPVCSPYNGTAMARFNSRTFTSGTSGLLISPPMIFNDDDYEISFWLYRDDAYTNNADKVEVLVNFTPTTVFASSLGTIHRSITMNPSTSETGWHQYSFVLPETYKNNLAFVILKGTSARGNNLFVDDFLIEVPATCFPPENIEVSGITSTTAHLNWTAVDPAEAWDIEVGLSGFEVGSGIRITGIAQTSLTLSGLEANTIYDVYLRGDCEADDQSIWSEPLTFTTLCFSGSPWEENFENQDINKFDCWQVMHNTTEDGGLNGNNLQVVNLHTWFVCTPESFNNNGSDYIFSGTQSAAIENTATGFNWLISGELLIPETGKNDLAFRIKYQSEETITTHFHINILSGENWSTLKSWTNVSENNDYQVPVYINLDEYNGQIVRLAFVYEANNGNALAIDDISLQTAQNYWLGADDKNWDNDLNWRLSAPEPASDEFIEILPAVNQPEISSQKRIGGIHIHPGASLTLLPDANVTVSGMLTNNSGADNLILKASDGMQALLFLSQESVPATVEFIVNASSNLHDGILFSSPVSGQEIAPMFAGINDHLLKWDAISASWISLKVEGGTWNPAFETEFQPGIGYFARFGEQGTRLFSGNLTGSSAEVNLPATSGWHLLGNPFSTSVKWQGSNTSFSAIIKMYNIDKGSFEDIAPLAVLPTMTGFFVSAEPGTTPDYAFEPWHRTHEEPGSTPIQGEGITLSVSETTLNTTQHARIIVDIAATNDYDHYLDSRFLAGFAPHLYSIAGDEILSLNRIPSVASGTVIQLGFVKNEASDYTIAIDADELFPGMVLYLNDKKTGNIQDVNGQTTYTFTAEEGDDANRFELIFGTLGIDGSDKTSDFMVFANNGIIEIRSTTSITGDIKITGLDGRTAISLQGNGSNNMKIDAGKLANGIYVVSLMNSNGITTRKVMVK
ncbi:MAG: S8 family serine peptidase [Lentimicrobium sp.]|nr:S8 family serine peptidase [Lentimicrobium sp.]